MTAVSVFKYVMVNEPAFHIFIEFIKRNCGAGRARFDASTFFGTWLHVLMCVNLLQDIHILPIVGSPWQILNWNAKKRNSKICSQWKQQTERKKGFSFDPFIMVGVCICIKPSNLSELLSIYRSKQLNHATYVWSFGPFLLMNYSEEQFIHSVFYIHSVELCSCTFRNRWNSFRSIFLGFSFFFSIFN